MDSQLKPRRNSSSDTRLVFGVLIIGCGVLMLLRLLHLLPSMWYTVRFGFPVILIAVGVLVGVRSNWRSPAWWILILIGVARLTPAFYIGDVPSKKLFWPVLCIAIGLAIIFRKRRPKPFVTPGADYQGPISGTIAGTLPGSKENFHTNTDAAVNIDVTFGGRKEIITSKNFSGGRVYASFAGAEVNLMQADSTVQPMILDLRVAFGSVELIVPSHWEIRNEITPTMGSVEDHRMVHTPTDPMVERRILILRGSCFCGSVEIKSY